MSSAQAPVPAWHRVDQIGSLVRPSELVTAFAQFDRGEIDAATLTRAQDEAIRAILQKQEEIRFPILVDGEFRRQGFQDSFGQAVSGFEARRTDSQRSAEER